MLLLKREVQAARVALVDNKQQVNFIIQGMTFTGCVRDEIEIHLWQSCYKSWKWRSIFLALQPVWKGGKTFIAVTAGCRIQVQGIEEYKKQGVLYSPDTKMKNSTGDTKTLR